MENKITKQELREIVDCIPELETRARIGMEYFSKNGDRDLAREYAGQYIDNFDPATPVQTKDSWSSHPIRNALRLMPDEKKGMRLESIKRKIIEGMKKDPCSVSKLAEAIIETERTTIPEIETELLGCKYLMPYARIDQDKKEIALNSGAYIAFSYFERKQDISKAIELVYNPDFQEKFSSHPTAKQIASKVVGSHIVNGKNLKDLETVIKTFDIEITPEDEARKLLFEGKLERADRISALFGYKIPNETFDKVYEQLKGELAEAAKNGMIVKAVNLKARINSLNEFREHGLNLDDVPQSKLYQDGGKFIIVNYMSRHFLRGAAPEEGWHRDILSRFEHELELRGFEVENIPKHEVSGAHYNIRANSMTIEGRSEDFGECDKDVAKKLMSQVFQGQITTKAYNAGGYY